MSLWSKLSLLDMSILLGLYNTTTSLTTLKRMKWSWTLNGKGRTVMGRHWIIKLFLCVDVIWIVLLSLKNVSNKKSNFKALNGCHVNYKGQMVFWLLVMTTNRHQCLSHSDLRIVRTVMELYCKIWWIVMLWWVHYSEWFQCVVGQRSSMTLSEYVLLRERRLKNLSKEE